MYVRMYIRTYRKTGCLPRVSGCCDRSSAPADGPSTLVPHATSCSGFYSTFFFLLFPALFRLQSSGRRVSPVSVFEGAVFGAFLLRFKAPEQVEQDTQRRGIQQAYRYCLEAQPQTSVRARAPSCSARDPPVA